MAKKKVPEGMAPRISVSILSFFGLLVFLVIWLFFYADGFTVYQNIGIFLAAIFVFLGINGAAWAPWGMKHADECEEWEGHHEKKNPARRKKA